MSRTIMQEQRGRGRAFIEAAIEAGFLVAEKRSRDVIAQAQPNLSATNGAVWGRRIAMRVLGLSPPEDRGQMLFRLWLGLPNKQKMQSFLGTWKRVLRDRLWRDVAITERAQ